MSKEQIERLRALPHRLQAAIIEGMTPEMMAALLRREAEQAAAQIP